MGGAPVDSRILSESFDLSGFRFALD